MEIALAHITNGLVVGCIYALMAMGLTLIFGVLRIINFAHGEFYMIGGYVSYFVTQSLGLPPLVGLFAAIGVTFVMGLCVEYCLLTPLYGSKLEHKDEYALLVTFALSIFMLNSGLAWFGPYQKASAALAEGSIRLGSLAISEGRLLAAAIAVVLLLIMLAVIKKTWVGIALRAISQDREAATVVGIKASTLGCAAFAIGTAMAGAAGSLLGPIFMISPEMGVMPAMKSFVIIVLGSMGSIRGALVGALIVGLAEALGAFLLNVSYRDAYAFVILVMILLLKPNGLFGGKQQWNN